MIEKIGTPYYGKLSTANSEVLRYVQKIKQRKQAVKVMEIGVGIGATSLKLYETMEPEDQLYLLDYEEKTRSIRKDLEELPGIGPKLCCLGNSRKTLDSYAWSIMKLTLEGETFNLVFLDGAHNFVFDGIVCSLMGRLLDTGGYFLVDDVSFRMQDLINHNLGKADAIQQLYTEEQRREKQLEKALQCYIYSNKQFEEIPCSKEDMKVFVKRG